MWCKSFVLLLIVSAALACRPALYMPASGDVKEQQELLSGRTLYRNRCSNCHNLHLPKDYNMEKWKKSIDEMQQRAKISNEEKQLILDYIADAVKH